MLKYALGILLLVCLSIGVWYIGDQEPLDDGLDTRPLVRFASEGAYPPFNYLDTDGTLKGFDIDIAKTLCDRANLRCTFAAQDWDGLIPALLSRKYDAIAASVSITAERQKVVSFTKRYYRTPIRFIAPSKTTLVISKEGLKGKVIGVQRATTSADFMQKNFADVVTIKFYDTQDTAYLDMTAGRIHAVVADAIQAWNWLKTPTGSSFGFVGETYFVDDGIGIALRKDDAMLIKKLNTALEGILKDGTYEKISKNYFNFSIY
jgi:lysine-arginine-ornithine-binding protein